MWPLATVAALLIMGAAHIQAAPQVISPGVYLPSSTPYDQTYDQWSAAHWQWEFAQPFDQHPLTMDGNVDLSLGQPSGPVWFLGGTFAVTTSGTTNIGIATRTGTVPLGKALFFPIIDAEDSVAEEINGIGCGFGTDEAGLRACAKFFANHITSVSCSIDGVEVKSLQNYRFHSKLFTWGPLPANNLFQNPDNFPGGLTSQAVSDGYFIMVAPLSAGSHTIHFAGTLVFTAAKDGFDLLFVEDITYNLTVQ